MIIKSSKVVYGTWYTVGGIRYPVYGIAKLAYIYRKYCPRSLHSTYGIYGIQYTAYGNWDTVGGIRYPVYGNWDTVTGIR